MVINDSPTAPGRSTGRIRCERCGLLQDRCVCARITVIDNLTPVRVLQHPREATHAYNTARWVALGLTQVAITAARAFSPDDWEVAGRRSVLLYPATEGSSVGALFGTSCDAPGAASGPWTLVVIDGTWSQAGALLRAHPALAALPRLALERPAQRSAYRLRKSPRADGLSTVEAVAAALDVLDAPRSHAALLRPFHAQIDQQLVELRQRMGEAAFARHYPAA